jgi:putative transposase
MVCRSAADAGVETSIGCFSRALDQWAYLHEDTLDFSRPGKPTDNALVESFNGRSRDECLNTNWFLSLDDARRKIEA